ncbi:MAG: MurR/RpiR family transcriptional regulator [Actinomycetota bacterium]
MVQETGFDGLHARAERHLAALGPAGRRVVTTLLADTAQLGYLSAAELGRLADTTDATVVRTVQRLGYDGLTDLKRSLLTELAAGDVASRYQTGSHDPGSGAIGRHLADAVDAVARLVRPEVRAAIDDAVRVLDGSEQIVVVAAGPTSGVARYAAAQWQRIGLRTRSAVGVGGPGPDDLAQLGASDTVVLIASGRPRRWARIAIDAIVEHRLPAVVLTDSLPAPGPDAVVVRSGRGPADRPATHTATIATIEAITAGLAELDPGRTATALDRLTATRRRFDD